MVSALIFFYIFLSWKFPSSQVGKWGFFIFFDVFVLEESYPSVPVCRQHSAVNASFLSPAWPITPCSRRDSEPDLWLCPFSFASVFLKLVPHFFSLKLCNLIVYSLHWHGPATFSVLLVEEWAMSEIVLSAFQWSNDKQISQLYMVLAQCEYYN